jgi:hypothetical protein
MQLPPSKCEIKLFQRWAQVNRSETASIFIKPASFSWNFSGIFEVEPNDNACHNYVQSSYNIYSKNEMVDF